MKYLLGSSPFRSEKELDPRATIAFYATVQNEGGRTVERQIEYYNLDAVISVGYRVNSKQGNQRNREQSMDPR